MAPKSLHSGSVGGCPLSRVSITQQLGRVQSPETGKKKLCLGDGFTAHKAKHRKQTPGRCTSGVHSHCLKSCSDTGTREQHHSSWHGIHLATQALELSEVLGAWQIDVQFERRSLFQGTKTMTSTRQLGKHCLPDSTQSPSVGRSSFENQEGLYKVNRLRMPALVLLGINPAEIPKLPDGRARIPSDGKEHRVYTKRITS